MNELLNILYENYLHQAGLKEGDYWVRFKTIEQGEEIPTDCAYIVTAALSPNFAYYGATDCIDSRQEPQHRPTLHTDFLEVIAGTLQILVICAKPKEERKNQPSTAAALAVAVCNCKNS